MDISDKINICYGCYTLYTAFLADMNVVGRVNRMGGKEGRKYVLKHWGKYTDIVIDSLTLKSYKGQIKKQDKSIELNFTTEVLTVFIFYEESY